MNKYINDIIVFINNLITYCYNVFEDFIRFMVEHKLLSLFVAGIIGLVIANLVSSVRINLFDYYLNKIFKTSNNNLINLFTTFVQSIIIIIFLYFIYNNFVVYFDTKYSVDKFNKFDEITWRNNILNEIRDIKKLI